ncbi:MAG: thiosulfate oxidation carrier complex protein SoxZ [Rhodocyclales bacterium GWA2_65_20]|nr:MAG: thiosulfate oxidation carrier complex protein SoxZ [Rhodocyclales bacterium GWA2_65_20]
MADPMKIRAQQKGDVTEIRVLVNHPMETGMRKDGDGNTVPAHYIQSFAVDIGGRRVIQGQTGTSIARNPVFAMKVKGVKAGDEVVVSWVDNKGDTRTDKAIVIN